MSSEQERGNRLKAWKQRLSPLPEPTKTTDQSMNKAWSKKGKNTRAKLSIYIDTLLMKDVDRILHEINIVMFPKRITKSQLLERLISRGISAIEELKAEIQEELA